MSARAAALWYAGQGWPVFPVWHLEQGACACPRGVDCASPGKHPRTARGVHDATTDAARIRAFWEQEPRAHIGIATGRASGGWVLDVDPPGGESSLEELVAEHGTLPTTPTVHTGSGGRHVYLQVPAGLTIRNRAALRPGLDVRGDGGYVVAPPAGHVSGGTYTWDTLEHVRTVPVAAAPAWLLGLVRRECSASAPRSCDWIELARTPVGRGQRNATLARLAGKVLRSNLDPRIAAELLAAWNVARCDPPLAPEEAARVIDSIARREAAKQR